MMTTTSSSELFRRFDQKTATISIVGLGYVGLPLVLRYAEVGYKVIGFDIDSHPYLREEAIDTVVGALVAAVNAR